MSLPKKHLKSATGQILILFLLVLVVGVAIVLSVASRTITDIRTTTTSDESNRAYFAAEAGIEEALQELQGGGSIPATGLGINFPTVNTSATTSDVTPSGGSAVFVYPEDVKKDEVVQVALLQDFRGDVANAANLGWAGTNLDFYWSSSDVDNADETPAIEISVIYYCPSGPSCPGYPVGQNFGISKITFDPNSSGRTNPNGFCHYADNPNFSNLGTPRVIEGKNFYFHATVNVFHNAEDCTGLKLSSAANTKPVLARIRLLYNTSQSSPVAVESTDASNPLPQQGTTLESTGTTSSGVARKLQVVRLYPALPALFDYVLFSGSNLSK